MKINVERGAFLKALSHVQSVVERRNTIPILSNVMLEAGKGALKLTATDLDIEIVESLPADILRNGFATAPAHMLYDIVRKLPDGAQVQAELLSSEGGRLAVSSGSSRFELACLPKEDFPQMAAGTLPHRFRLAADDIKRIIDKTRFAISTEETRYYLNGVYIHAAKDAKPAVMRAVATDGHRLARYELELPAGAEQIPGVIIPRKTVAELRKLLDDAEGAIEISLSDTKIQFGFNGVELTSKLIDGNFPPYERVIPSGNDKVLGLDAKEFSQSVDRVSTISADKTRAVKLNIAKDKVTLSVVNPESGTATEDVGATYRAATLEIGFNARYLLDITGQIEGKEARFLLSDAGSPAIIEDAEDPRTLYVLMPLRV
jgi:DNA polymerase-3 subunit beta